MFGLPCGRGVRGRVLALALLVGLMVPAIASARPAPRADLGVISLQASPTRGVPGTAMKVTAWVENAGLARAGRRSTLALYLQRGSKRHALGRRVVGKLAVRGRSRAILSVKLPKLPAARYRLAACADVHRRLREAREENNCRRLGALVTLLTVPAPSPWQPPAEPQPPPAPPGSPAPSPVVPGAPPAVTLDTPGQSSFTRDPTPALSGSADAGAGPVTVRLYGGATASGTPDSRTSAPAPDGSWSLDWPDALADGTYTAEAEQTDAFGQTTVSDTRTFTVDTAAPSLAVLAPGEGVRTADTTPDVHGTAGTAAGDAGTVTIGIYSGATPAGEPVHELTATPSPDGAWTVTPPSPALGDGPYSAYVAQADAAGNQAAVTRGFTVDADAPALTLTVPAPGSVLNTTTPQLSGMAGAAAGDSSTVEVKLYRGPTAGVNLARTLSATRASDGTWTTSVPAAAPLAEDYYTAEARQSDDTGKTASAQSTFRVNAARPVVRIDQPANSSAGTNRTPAFTGDAGNEPGDSGTVEVRVYTGTTAAGPYVSTTGTRDADGAFTTDATSSLTDGTYTAQARQADEFGTGTSPWVTFAVDNTGPAVTVDTPAAGARTNDTTPSFGGAAGTAARDETAVTVRAYDSAGALVATVPADVSSGRWTASITPTLGEGDYTLRATQQDSLGNATTTAPRAFTIDTTAPTVAIGSPAAGEVLTDSTPTLSGTTDGDSPNVTVKLYSGTSAIGTPVQTLSAPRSGTTWTTTASPALGEGTYTARAEHRDLAGNTGTSATRTFSIDAVPPAVTLETPEDGSQTADRTPTLSGAAGTYPGDLDTVTVKVYRGSDTTGTLAQTLTATQSGGHWSVDAGTLDEGPYAAQAEQADSDGQTGRSTVHRFEIGPATLLAAGDIASCSNSNDSSTQALLATRPGVVATLGDNVYGDATNPEATLATFMNCYGPNWGLEKARTRPSAGNHEYFDPGAGGYFSYFGAAAATPGNGWYSYDLGDWHIVVLNSNTACTTIACTASSPQVQWLDADLAANPRSCTLAYWHHPLFTSESASITPAVKPFWDVLQARGADLVLNGHAHDYERFRPQTPTGVADPNGIRQFVVGTGGRSLRPATGSGTGSELFSNAAYGILELKLHASSYDWRFVPAAGQTFTDSGSGSCH